jgi:hypothetical protein
MFWQPRLDIDGSSSSVPTRGLLAYEACPANSTYFNNNLVGFFILSETGSLKAETFEIFVVYGKKRKGVSKRMLLVETCIMIEEEEQQLESQFEQELKACKN